jgi:uncharacterized RDD family membrane protein YckC
MYCSRCGALQADGAAFCGVCGQPLGAAARPANPALAAPGVSPPVAPLVGAYPAVAAPLYAPYAGFWLRLVAYIIDAAVLCVGIGVFVLIWVAIFGLSTFRSINQGFDSDNFMAPVAVLFLFILIFGAVAASWLYYACLESSTHQATLGKMALGLIVTDTQGRRVTFGRASGRFFAKIITGLIPFWIGYIMAGFTEKKQALHDMIASCLVLRKI